MKFTYRWQFALSVGVLALAAFLRFWQITQTPPGLYLDEAYHLLRAQAILRGETLPVFITGNNGYEPLVVYLVTVPLMLLGPVAWAGRLLAAWAGLFSVALTIRVGKEMFPHRAIGPLAGLGLATLFWSLTFSRFGSQPILAATAAAAAMAALWRGARANCRRAYVLAGVSLGLGLNAYLGFRLFPLALLIAGLALLLAQRQRRRSILAGGLLAAGVAALLFAPLGFFFIQNPQWFFARFNQTTAATLGAASPAATLGANALKTLGGLFWVGDSNWRHNLAGRPALDAAQALFFCVGIGACLRQWRQPEAWALGAWLLVGLSPSMLTYQAPHFGRTTMAVPAIALLMAVGITALWERAASRPARTLLIVALTLSVILTGRDFFGRWAQAADLFEYFEVQQTLIARALQAAPDEAPLYATPLHVDYYHELWPIEFWLGPEAYRRFASFNGRVCQVIPAHTATGATYAVIVPADHNTPAALQAAYPALTHYSAEKRAGAPYLEVYQIPAGQTAKVNVSTLRRADFGGLVELVGYTLSPETLKPGGRLQLAVTWKAEQRSPAPEAYKIFIHLLGPPQSDGNRIYTQQDAEPCANTYPTWQWHAGDLVSDTYLLPLPVDLPPAEYTLQVGWYQSETGARLPVADDAGQPVGDALILEHLHLGVP